MLKTTYPFKLNARQSSAAALVLGLALSLSVGMTSVVWAQNGDTNAQDYYANFYDQAMTAYQKGDSTTAIDLLTKAFRLAPNNAAILNNLAAAYIQRGVGFQNKNKNYASAADDYRKALFYLEYMWPASVQKTPSNTQNVDIARDNLTNAIKGLQANPADAKWHQQAAVELQRKGQLQGALVEYAWVTRLAPNAGDAWLKQGDLLGVFQRWDKALAAYQKAAQATPSPSDVVFVKLGTAFLQTQNAPKAVDMFNKALALKPKNRDALLGLEQVWRKEIGLNPNNMSAHLNLGAVYQQLERYDDAQGQYALAQRMAPSNPLVPLNIGSLLMAKKQYQAALTYFDQALKIDPNNAQALTYKADALKELGRTDDAAALLQKAAQHGGPAISPANTRNTFEDLVSAATATHDATKIKSAWASYAAAFPNDADVAYRAGLALHEQKAYPDAVAYYQQAIRLDAKNADAYANLGSALVALNRQSEAADALNKAIAINPKLDSAKSLLAKIQQGQQSQLAVEASKFHEQGQLAKAVPLYEKALAADPTNDDILSRYGLALQGLKRYDEALKAYDKAINLNKKEALYPYYKGTLLAQQGKPTLAKTAFESALMLDPNLTQAKEAIAALQSQNAETLLLKAYEAYDKKQYPQAQSMLNEVLKADPNNAMAHYYQGLVYEATQKMDQAKASYEKAVTLNPKFGDALYALAVVCDTQGQVEPAKKYYQAFLTATQGQPEDEFIKYAKERLTQL